MQLSVPKRNCPKKVLIKIGTSPGCPLVVKLPLFGRVSNICRVEEEAEHLRLVKAAKE